MRTYLLSFLFFFSFHQITAQDYDLTLVDRYAYGPSSNIEFSEHNAFVNSGANIVTLNISDPANIEVISTTQIGMIILDFTIHNNMLYSISHDSLYVAEILENGDLIIRNSQELTWASMVSCFEDFLIVFTRSKQFILYNIEDPLNPAAISGLELPDKVQTMVQYDNYIITAHAEDYLGIINISNKSNPKWDIYKIPGNDYVVSTCLVQDTLYVGANDSLLAYKILPGGALSKLGSTKIQGARRLDVRKGLAFLAGQGYRLQIYNVQDISNMLFVSKSGPSVEHVVVKEDVAYCFQQDAGLWLTDVSDPENTQLLSELELGEVCFDIEKSNDKLYFASGAKGIRTLHLDQIDRFSSTLTPERPSDYIKSLSLDYPYLYAADDNGKLWVFKISSDGSLNEGQFIETENIKNLNKHGDLLILCGSWPGGSITMVNVADPENPIIESKLKTGNPINAAVVVGEYLYAQEYSKNIKIIDFSDPANLIIVDSIDFPYSRTHNMVLYNNLLFLASGELVTFDVSDPLNPVRVENRINEWNIYRVAIQEDFLFLAKEEGLSIYNISNYDQPKLIASSDAFSGRDVHIEGDQVFLMDARAGLYWYELLEKTTPTQPNISGMNARIKLYPNPTGGNIQLDFDGFPKELIIRIELISLSGKVKTLFQITDGESESMPGQFVLDDPTGTYFVQLITSTTTYTEKLVLMR